jgi:hypothetical protein
MRFSESTAYTAAMKKSKSAQPSQAARLLAAVKEKRARESGTEFVRAQGKTTLVQQARKATRIG